MIFAADEGETPVAPLSFLGAAGRSRGRSDDGSFCQRGTGVEPVPEVRPKQERTLRLARTLQSDNEHQRKTIISDLPLSFPSAASYTLGIG